MANKLARGYSQRPGRTSLTWRRQPSVPSSNKVCAFWSSGNCTRNPCRFLHSEPTVPPDYDVQVDHSGFKKSQNSQRWLKNASQRVEERQNQTILKEQKSQISNRAQHWSSPTPINYLKNKICEYWLKGNCVHGEKCKYLHAWSCGNALSMLAQLEGHKKAVTGIALPSGFDKLFTGSKDGTVRVWNCHTGECTCTFDVGSPVGCLISEGPLVFVGIENAVKAWNIQTNAELTLSAPGGQVHAMSVATNGMLFAGVNDGSVLAWTFNSGTNSFDATASLKGHAGAVVSLVVGAGLLYSGSVDNRIRVWDLETMQCIHTLNKHSDIVMSMVCWDQYLLSCSLDQTLKVWAATEAGDLEVVYTHEEEHGILSLCGMPDAEGKPILLCSCNDNSVCLYELPSFVERGRTFARQEVKTIEAGPGGLFFTGDGTGRVSVWRLSSAKSG